MCLAERKSFTLIKRILYESTSLRRQPLFIASLDPTPYVSSFKVQIPAAGEKYSHRMVVYRNGIGKVMLFNIRWIVNDFCLNIEGGKFTIAGDVFWH